MKTLQYLLLMFFYYFKSAEKQLAEIEESEKEKKFFENTGKELKNIREYMLNQTNTYQPEVDLIEKRGKIEVIDKNWVSSMISKIEGKQGYTRWK